MLAFVFQSEPPAVSSSWKQQGRAIVGDAAFDYLGTSVALSADAGILVVGAPGDMSNMDRKGYVRVYHTDKDDGSRIGQTIYGNAIGDLFGWSVDITTEGNNIVLGAPGYYNNTDRPGYVRVYSLDNNDEAGDDTWNQIGQDIIGEANGDEFGVSVSISEDGKMIVVGADAYDGRNGDDSGHVRVYRMDDSSTSWTQVGEDIDGKASVDYSGYAVSLSADGTTVAIGATGNNDNGVNSGHVRIFSIK